MYNLQSSPLPHPPLPSSLSPSLSHPLTPSPLPHTCTCISPLILPSLSLLSPFSIPPSPLSPSLLPLPSLPPSLLLPSSCRDIQQLLSVSFAHSDPSVYLKDSYLLLVTMDTCGAEGQWTGKTLEMKTSAETTFAVSEMQVT